VKIITVLVFSCLLGACGGPFEQIAERYPARSPFPAEMQSKNILFTDGQPGSIRTVDLRIAFDEEAVHIGSNPILGIGGTRATIPMEAITGCSMTCFGNTRRDTNLLLGELGLKISMTESPEVIEWCWESSLPMISGKDEREWLYASGQLPSKAGYLQVDREEYRRQTRRSCQGY